MPRTALRICPLCEATCGLTLTLDDGRVTGARGDRDDVFSKGFICPRAPPPRPGRGPDRLRTPLVRVDGELREATWEEAFGAVAAGVRPVVERYGPHSVGVVLGNPNVHTVAGALYPPVLIAGLGTRSLFTASTLDQMPKHVSSGLLFGDANAIPVPDLDRTDHLLLIGANPLESDGSLCTAPDFPGRLRALRARGGTLTVIDPRRTRTARLADRHLAIRPGTDALLLAAMTYVLVTEDLVDLGESAPMSEGSTNSRTPSRTSPRGGGPLLRCRRGHHPHPRPRTLRRSHCRRLRPHRQLHRPARHLAGWLVDVLNTLTGNLDRPGGVLFPLAATGRAPRPAGPGRGFALGRWLSRVSRHPEAKGELPLSALAEEIDTATDEGEPVRALIAVAANPVLSAPDGDRLDKALGSLDFMVSVDPYLNETSRHAHVVLRRPRPRRARTTTSPSTPSPCATRSATPAPRSHWNPAAWRRPRSWPGSSSPPPAGTVPIRRPSTGWSSTRPSARR
ncbi:molybdopterin-dependent oxidoreductase [Streptomyces sp. INA 01156]